MVNNFIEPYNYVIELLETIYGMYYMIFYEGYNYDILDYILYAILDFEFLISLFVLKKILVWNCHYQIY